MTHRQDETVGVTCIVKVMQEQVQVKDDSEDKSSVVKAEAWHQGCPVPEVARDEGQWTFHTRLRRCDDPICARSPNHA